ncbi:hypothetical protein E4U57_008206 [Claviceps arundinis]|uniref:Uncharacterized protein n=1 Tax=Claviceps arundinis TaxID=1623583 RepID=A0A9P7MW31_9HYPO|nr:hypothetical protein E4U57_008206 [Claviceps arundinis]KAG5972051.1 hypothetical protein E4U56_006415 [Claviceps arundinis]
MEDMNRNRISSGAAGQRGISNISGIGDISVEPKHLAMAAFHKQQQADQRTKLNRGRWMPHRAFPQMHLSSILRSGGMNNTAMAPACLGRRPVATYHNWRRRQSG